MSTLRKRYHGFGNKINIALMGVGMAKQYMAGLSAVPLADEQTVKDALASCAAAEKALLELDGEMSKLKALTYRLIDPDQNIRDLAADIRGQNTGIRILVVDDEPEVCALVRAFYQKRGFSVDWASAGDSAIQKISSEYPPHIVILDLYLHGAVEGEDVLRHLKATRPAIKCVVVTSEDDPERRKSLDALLPDAVMVKPVLPAQLDARINGFIAGLQV